jgi:2-amino-4-hydroxy-6-hydroxymethyldihydropteridine diphosphokinase
VARAVERHVNAVERWIPAYVGLGSNLDDPPAQLRRACAALASLPTTVLVAVSGFYRNPPMGVTDQPDFVNGAAGLLTQLPPRELLAALKRIERAQGRDQSASPHWGPRTIDLDLLVYGEELINEKGFVLPHPGIAERNFVLFPLLEIAPGLTIPGCGQVRDLATRLDENGLTRLA